MKKFLPLILVFLVFLMILPRSAKLNYDYRKGAPWKHETLIAPFDFPILKTEDQLVEERMQAEQYAVPYYRYMDDVVNGNLRAAETIDLEEYDFLRPSVVASLKAIYERGVVGDDGLASPSEIVYVQRNKHASSRPASEISRLADARSAFSASPPNGRMSTWTPYSGRILQRTFWSLTSVTTE